MKYFLHISAWVVRPDNQRVGKVLGLGMGWQVLSFLLKIFPQGNFLTAVFSPWVLLSLWWRSLGESASGLLQGGSWGTLCSCAVGGGKNLCIQPHRKVIFTHFFCVVCPASVPYLSMSGVPPSPECLLCSVTPISSLLLWFPVLY